MLGTKPIGTGRRGSVLRALLHSNVHPVWVQLGGLVAFLLIIPFARHVDPDFWWHLRTGELIVTSGLPSTDPFSWTAGGTAWVMHEWLSEALLYAVYTVFGYVGSVLMFGFAATGALGLTLGQAMQPSNKQEPAPETETQRVIYMPELARAQEKLDALLGFKSVNPLYGSFLADQLGIANREERIQALESVLELPRPLLKKVRVPPQEELPPGPLARERLDTELIRRGLIAAPLGESDDDDHHSRVDDHDAKYPPTLAEKLRLLFDAKYGHVHGVKTQPVWAAGKLLEFNGDFDKYIKAIDLVKQEGIVFRHFLRLILLCAEFALVSPPDADAAEWQEELRELADRLTETCRDIDPQSTEKTIEQIQAGDALTGQARGT